MKSGLKIKELRDREGMNISQLAAKLDVSGQTITNWEASDPFPKGENFKKLCEFFKVEESFFEVEQPEVRNITSDLVEELKATLEFLKDQIGILNKEKADANKEKAELMKLLSLALSGNSPKPKGSIQLVKTSLEESPENTTLKLAKAA